MHQVADGYHNTYNERKAILGVVTAHLTHLIYGTSLRVECSFRADDDKDKESR